MLTGLEKVFHRLGPLHVTSLVFSRRWLNLSVSYLSPFLILFSETEVSKTTHIQRTESTHQFMDELSSTSRPVRILTRVTKTYRVTRNIRNQL